jgi:uncharacterized protein YeaO (DUF488 family)
VKLRTKRIYEEPAKSDGRRILVDRLWPRGITKANAKIECWAKEISPSNELRRWYQHDPDKWSEFRRRYFKELAQNPEGVAELRAKLGKGIATLVYSSKETELNNASALIEYLEANS